MVHIEIPNKSLLKLFSYAWRKSKRKGLCSFLTSLNPSSKEMHVMVVPKRSLLWPTLSARTWHPSSHLKLCWKAWKGFKANQKKRKCDCILESRSGVGCHFNSFGC